MFNFSFLRRGVKKNYEIDKKELGKGKFATVRRGVHRKSGQVMRKGYLTQVLQFLNDSRTCRLMLSKLFTKIDSRGEWYNFD
jgi:hypothetical protein